MPFQPSKYSSLKPQETYGDSAWDVLTSWIPGASSSTPTASAAPASTVGPSTTVSDGTGTFLLTSNGNIQLISAKPGTYPNVGQTWTPTSSGYNDIIWNLVMAYPDNRSKMEKVIGSVAVTRALGASSKGSGTAAASFVAKPAAPSLPAPSPSALPHAPTTTPSGGIGGVATKAPGGSTEPTGITSQVWFWPVVALTATAVIGGGAYYFYTRSKKTKSAPLVEADYQEPVEAQYEAEEEAFIPAEVAPSRRSQLQLAGPVEEETGLAIAGQE